MDHPETNLATTMDDNIPNPVEMRPSGVFHIQPFIGISQWHKETLRSLRDMGESGHVMAIVGDAGVGKSLLAQHIHGRTNTAACEKVDVRKIPAEIVDSELFGYVRSGIFHKSELVPGLLPSLENGTCIIEGIETLPATTQERLLQWLTTGEATPAGSDVSQRFPARAIIELRLPFFPRQKESTLIPPLFELFRKSFIEVPTLSSRRDDIIPIAEHYLSYYSSSWGIGEKRLSSGAARLLKRAAWRENVRSLVCAVAGSVIGGSGAQIEPEQLPPWVAGRVSEVTKLGLDGVALEELVEQKLALFFERLGRYEVHDVYETIMEKVERPLLKLVMKQTGGNQLKAARILGINRNTLRTKLKALLK